MIYIFSTGGSGFFVDGVYEGAEGLDLKNVTKEFIKSHPEAVETTSYEADGYSPARTFFSFHSKSESFREFLKTKYGLLPVKYEEVDFDSFGHTKVGCELGEVW